MDIPKVKVKWNPDTETYSITVNCDPKLFIYIERLSTEKFSMWAKDIYTDEQSQTIDGEIETEEENI